ncbi:MAG: lamin tail domain-containing protein [Bacteroidetes bacterium]|nr:lamin tail domain-containing protein [Bacteroidota bacterium]MBL7006705.1 lamin tail domain-containing protein [Spirochaetia bacterium]
MTIRKSIICIIILIFVYSPSVYSVDKSELILASWNIRILSNNSRDSEELQYISNIIKRYDLIAVQEVRDEEVLKRILDILPAEWSYIISDQVGRGVKERYAYLFNTNFVTALGNAYLLEDPEDVFIREPFISSFVSEKFDFTLITFHALFGDSINDRRKEIRLLPEVINLVDAATGNERDIILLGDFNMPSNDKSWMMDPYVAIIPYQTKTTISDTSSYDNIWLHKEFTYKENFKSLYEVYSFDEILFNNDDRLASTTCSDHRPISIVLNVLDDNDISENWFTTAQPIIQPNVNSNKFVNNKNFDLYSNYKPGDIEITQVIWTPTEKESVIIKNLTENEISLEGWTLGDKNSPDSYVFPFGSNILAKETLIIHHSVLNFIINNSNEIIFLKRPDKVVIDLWESE